MTGRLLVENAAPIQARREIANTVVGRKVVAFSILWVRCRKKAIVLSSDEYKVFF